MKCKSKTVRGAKAIAVSIAVLCGLCICFASCSDDADDTTTTGGSETGFFGSSDSDYSGFVTLLSSLSDGCTIVLSPELTSEQLSYFGEALMNSPLSNVTVDMSYMTITEINADTFSYCTNIKSVTALVLGDDRFIRVLRLHRPYNGRNR